MKFALSDYELADLKKAFDGIMDKDGKISFQELFYNVEKQGYKESRNVEEKLLYGILSKIMDNKELSCDKKINFE